MNSKIQLANYGTQLWTRAKAREIKSYVDNELEKLQIGGTLIIDIKDVEVFDYSFANELFGKSQLNIATEYPGRFIVLENLNSHTRENLVKGLEELNLMAIERKAGKLVLIGKIHPADQATFDAIVQTKEPITSAQLKEVLKVNVNAMNERLNKLTSLGVIRREKTISAAGREQFVYSSPI